MKRSFSVLITVLLFFSVTIPSGCTKQRSYIKTHIGIFDTVTTITGYMESKQAFDENAQKIIAELQYYHKLFDIYNTYPDINNIKTINDNAGIKEVAVPAEIIELLSLSSEIYTLTNGKFNIAMGSVLKIWHEYRTEGNSVPTKDELNSASAHTDPENIIINKESNTVYIRDPELSIDVGAIAKGFAVQKATDFARSIGLDNIIINVGGNVSSVSAKPDGAPWNVGVEKPFGKANELLCVVESASSAVVTSAVDKRYYEVNGKKYHHIIDPETLMPSERYLSVTVISPDSGIADALSTALFNMSVDEGKVLLNNFENTHAMWYLPDGSTVCSAEFNKHVQGGTK